MVSPTDTIAAACSARTCTARLRILRSAPKCLVSRSRRQSPRPLIVNSSRPGSNNMAAGSICWGLIDMTDIETTVWESLRDEPLFRLRRDGRFLVADLKGVHQVISTSVRLGGWSDRIEWLVN